MDVLTAVVLEISGSASVIKIKPNELLIYVVHRVPPRLAFARRQKVPDFVLIFPPVGGISVENLGISMTYVAGRRIRVTGLISAGAHNMRVLQIGGRVIGAVPKTPRRPRRRRRRR